jgi:hypothetical protein
MTDGNWNFNETRRLVRARFGEPQEELISPCLDSLRSRQLYAEHHLKSFDELVADRLKGTPDDWTPVRLVLPASTDEARKNQELRSGLAAEATAWAASLHCLLDTLGHVVAYSLGMNLGPDPLGEHDISLRRVKTRLASTRAAPAVAQSLAGIDKSDDIAYLNALVNHSKHRSVIRPGFVFDATSDMEAFSIEFERFPFGIDKNAKADTPDKRKWHERREVKSALNKAHGFLLPWIVDVGNQLNDHLAREAAVT